MPVLGDFSGLFSSFKTRMQATSLFSLPGALTGSMPGSGSCTMIVPMPDNWGGNMTLSFCDWPMTGFRGVLLVIAGFAAVRIVVGKGGGG